MIVPRGGYRDRNREGRETVENQKRSFDLLAEIIGPDLMREVIKQMAGTTIRVRKQPRYAKSIFFGDREYYMEMGLTKAARSIGCSLRYLKKLSYAKPLKRGT